MSEHLQDELSEFVLGTLPPDRRPAVEEHLRVCRECSQHFEALSAGVLSFDRAVAEPVRGIARLKEALSGSRRLEHFVPELAELFQLDEAAARALVERIDSDEGWEPGPAEGITLLPVEAGPGVGAALSAIVKMRPGAVFPEHEHFGTEKVLVIQGGYRELEGGLEVWRGECSVRHLGSTHAFQALEGPPCICCSLVRLDEGEGG